MLVCFNLGETFWYALIWQIGRPIFKYCRVCSNVLIFFLYFVGFLLQTFDVFQLREPNWGFLSDAGMFHFGRGLLVRFNLVDWKTHFSILQGLLECFTIFFRFFGVFLQTFDFFQLSGPIWGFLSDTGMFHFGRGLLVCFNLVDWKTHFSILQGCSNVLLFFLDFLRFFCRLLMFSSCWDQFGDF